MDQNLDVKKTPSLRFSLILLFIIGTFMVVGIRVFKAPLAVVMFLAWLIINAFAHLLGYTYTELEKIAINTISNSLQAVIIMLGVGVLISSWIAAGTVPTIIDYGLEIINPKFFLFTSLIICAITSLFTGTSWGTIGTVGIALLGIGNGMGVNPGMTAGAIISGAWFGDKLSPLSDTTNFASSVMGVPLMTHIKSMLYSSVPTFIATAIIFLVLGFGDGTSAVSTDAINNIQAGLNANFKLGLIPLIPMVVVITLLLKQRPPAQSILIGGALGMLIAIAYQGMDISMVLQAALTGFDYEFSDEFLTTLLNRGGMDSMTRTIQALIFTTGMGGMLREMRILNVIVDKISHKIKSAFQSILAAMLVSYSSIALTGSHMFAAIMVESTCKDLFKRNGLKPQNASRICEDCGTLGVTLIPYGVTALFIVDTLGIAFTEYVPYAFFCYLSPVFTLILALTGFGIFKYSESEMKVMEQRGEIWKY